MGKLRAFLIYIPLAVAAAGLFGALHDQISYTVSPEYYTKFKFTQFGLLDTAVPERLRAAEVGFLASWWMGLPLGLLTGLAGFMHPTAQRMWRALLLSLPVAIGVVLTLALAGLAYGAVRTAQLDIGAYRGWYIPVGLEHPRAFLCVGTMHKAAYLGGVLAVPVTWLFHAVLRRRMS